MIALPPQVHVIVRDWLSANHIVLRGRDEAVVVDTGYATRAPWTLALLRSDSALGTRPLAGIVNTHCHSDHMGGNAALAEAYGCPIAIPHGEFAPIQAWDERALLLDYADQTADRFTPQQALHAGESYRWGDLDWRAVAAPGHDMGALCFHNEAHGILISGDALWRNGFGFVMPPQFDEAALPATRATLDTLSRLRIDVVIPGHGEPFADVGDALRRAFTRLEAYEADPARLARHAVKVVLAFKLLESGGIAVDDLPAYVERVGLYRDFNARCIGLAPAALAGWLVAELERAGAARLHENRLVPALGE